MKSKEWKTGLKCHLWSTSVLFAPSWVTELIIHTVPAVFCGNTEKPGVKRSLVFALSCSISWSFLPHFTMSLWLAIPWKFGAGTAEWVSQQRMLVVCSGSTISLSGWTCSLSTAQPYSSPSCTSPRDLSLSFDTVICRFGWVFLFDFSKSDISDSYLAAVDSFSS